jgi:ribonuclease VapC
MTGQSTPAEGNDSCDRRDRLRKKQRDILPTVALNIKDSRADRLARELAAETGESITVAVTIAVTERLQRLHGAVPLAILFDEPEREVFVELLSRAEDPLISAATLLEASMVMFARIGEDGVGDLDDLLAAVGVRCIAVDDSQARLARACFARFGKGQHPAGLNYGDCFVYGLAKVMNRSLLFKGTDFSLTDVEPAHL